MIAAMRIKRTSKRILMGNIDLNAAYRHIHANAQISATCIVIVGKIAFLYLRLPFGTTPTPSEYTTISEAEIDLGDDLLADMSWDAKNLQLPHRHLLPREYYLPSSDLLVKAEQLTVDIKAKEASMYGLIDDVITIKIDNTHLVERAKNAALLIIHTIFRPRKSNKLLKRYDPLSLCKLVGEGQLAERKTCLEWDIHNCSLRVSPPREKETAWVHGIRSSLSLTKINTDKLESLIGELNHAAHIIPPERYFLNRLRNLLNRGKKWAPERLQSWHRQELQHWIKILQWVTDTGVLI